jgi:poly-beta-1,6-N-acetyl-D-glucosamine synthase
VYNERRVLKEKLQNITAINYPIDKIRFLFGSDGSSDGSNEVLGGSGLSQVRIHAFPERRGKVAVLNDLVCEAGDEILIFSDGNTMFHPDTIRDIVRPFSDPRVGAVSGQLKLIPHPLAVGALGESSYWTFENLLKQMESDYDTIVGATGGIYAIRRSLFQPLPTNKGVMDDLLIPLNVVKQGYQVKYERRARAFEIGELSIGDEFRRKVRNSALCFNTISEFSSLLHPRSGFIAFALWSHKIVRWCVPFLLIVVFASCLALAPTSSFYGGFLLGILALLGIATLGFIFDKLKVGSGPLTFPYYFLAMNAALLVGFIKFALGKQRSTWDVARAS